YIPPNQGIRRPPHHFRLHKSYHAPPRPRPRSTLLPQKNTSHILHLELHRRAIHAGRRGHVDVHVPERHDGAWEFDGYGPGDYIVVDSVCGEDISGFKGCEVCYERRI